MSKFKERATKLKTDLPVVYLALKNEQTPFLAKFFAVLTVCYALSPIDLIPDFIPVLGYFDDVILLPFLVILTIKFIPKDIWEEAKADAEGQWKNSEPKKWYFALPILLFWAIIVFLIIKTLL